MEARKKLIIIGAIIGILIVVSIIYALIPRASLLISVAPSELTVSINSKEQNVKNGQELTVSPGSLEIILSRDGFKNHTEKIDIKNGETKEILFVLTAVTDEARQLLLTDESQQIIQRIANNKLQSAGDELLKKYPLIGELPINDKFYSITPCSSEKSPNNPKIFAICIKLFESEAKQSALDDIKNRGFNPGDYEIIIQDNTYTSPDLHEGE